MWFTEIAKADEPKRKQLVEFVNGILKFLDYVLTESECTTSLFENDERDLLLAARETFELDVRTSAKNLSDKISEIPDQYLDDHGLIDRPMKFKLRVLETISSRSPLTTDERNRTILSNRLSRTIRGWLKQMFDAIDAILDSLIDAAGGTGGLIKEFKDALCALAQTP